MTSSEDHIEVPAAPDSPESPSLSPLDTIIKEMTSAIPFNKENVKLIKCFRDSEAKKQDGELFLCVDKDCKDVFFYVKGICQYAKTLAISPQFVPSARRYAGVKNDRYTIKVTLNNEDKEEVESAKNRKFLFFCALVYDSFCLVC